MIISHKYRFIFIKTNKTAGTSIEIALSRFCGEDDVITPISPEDEEIRHRLGYPGPQNYKVRLSDCSPGELFQILLHPKRVRRYFNHISSEQVRAIVGEEIWNEYYTFCFERNPLERFLSFYYWKNPEGPLPGISNFMESGALSLLKRRGIDLYTIAGEVVVDRVCLFENLEAELEQVRLRVGIPEKLELPRTKSKSRKDKRSHREILTVEQAERLKQVFSAEIALFGYEL